MRAGLRGITTGAGAISLAALLLGCSGAGNGSQTVSAEPGGTACEEPRPEMCIQVYDPACGRKADGSTQQYPNGCEACRDAQVVSFRPGTC